MEPVAIGLDNQATVPPQEIDDEGADPYVDLGFRQTVAPAEPQEAVLQLAAGGVPVHVPLANIPPEGLGLAHGSPELHRRSDTAQVRQGPSRIGGRDAVSTSRSRASQ